MIPFPSLGQEKAFDKMHHDNLVGNLCSIGCFSLVLWAISPKRGMLLDNVQLSLMSSWTLTSLIEKHTGPLLYPTSGFDTWSCNCTLSCPAEGNSPWEACSDCGNF